MRLLAFGGWYGSGNVGDDAILIGLRRILAEAMPGSELVALSTDPEQTERVCGVEAARLMSPRRLLAHVGEYRGVFSEADAVIVTGGTPFYDWDHVSRLVHWGMARGAGKPVVCFGVGAKEIASAHGRMLVRSLLTRSVRTSARDQVSQRRLEALSGRGVSLTGDSALFLEPAPRGVVGPILSEAGLSPDSPLVVICPRTLSSDNRAHYHDPVGGDRVASIRLGLARLADALLREGHQVLFVPFHAAEGDDDRREIGVIRGAMRERGAAALDHTPSPEAVASLLGSARLVVGLRLHSLILAASQGVPVVSVGYDEKIAGFLELAGVSEYIVEPNDLRGRAFDALDRREQLGGILHESCAGMKARVMEEAKMVAEILSG
ncbi:MAG: polysaccharide pyruvyl transferase family protein [Candidatus Bathyarchaeia archaeon]